MRGPFGAILGDKQETPTGNSGCILGTCEFLLDGINAGLSEVERVKFNAGAGCMRERTKV